MKGRLRPVRGPGPGEGGFVLPVALFVLVILAMVSAAGLHTARGDFRAAEATRQAAVALAAADAGASRTLALWSQLVPAAPPPGDSLVLNWQELPDGSQYRSVVHRAPVAGGGSPTSLVLLRTTGRVRPPGTARRTVLLVVQPGAAAAWCCDAGVKVRGGLRVTGAAGVAPNSGVAGEDHVPAEWGGGVCPSPSAPIPGVLAPDTTAVELRSGGTVTGSPRIREDRNISAADFAAFGTVTYAQLAALADVRLVGNQRFRDEIRPVVTGGACATGVVTNWGAPRDPSGPCGSHAPIVHVAGNLIVQGADEGQGLLLVDGDLTIQGPFRFQGIIIVGERMRFTAAGRIFGAVLARGGSGGNRLSEITSGGRIMFSSCAVQRAMARVPVGGPGGSSASAVERSWFEVMP